MAIKGEYAPISENKMSRVRQAWKDYRNGVLLEGELLVLLLREGKMLEQANQEIEELKSSREEKRTNGVVGEKNNYGFRKDKWAALWN